jgi:hypothetical protein
VRERMPCVVVSAHGTVRQHGTPCFSGSVRPFKSKEIFMFCINIFIVDIKMLKPGLAREILDTGPAQEMLVLEYLHVICFFLLP